MFEWIKQNRLASWVTVITTTIVACCFVGLVSFVGLQQSGMSQPPIVQPIFQPENEIPQSTPTSIKLKFDGNGNSVQEFTITSLRVMTLGAGCKGNGNFFVRIINRDTGRRNHIVNERCPYNGMNVVRFQRDGTYLLEVEADGLWIVILWQ